MLLNNDDERFPPCRFADGAALREQFRSHTVIPTVWLRAYREGVLMLSLTDDDENSSGEVSQGWLIDGLA